MNFNIVQTRRITKLNISQNKNCKKHIKLLKNKHYFFNSNPLNAYCIICKQSKNKCCLLMLSIFKQLFLKLYQTIKINFLKLNLTYNCL